MQAPPIIYLQWTTHSSFWGRGFSPMDGGDEGFATIFGLRITPYLVWYSAERRNEVGGQIPDLAVDHRSLLGGYILYPKRVINEGFWSNRQPSTQCSRITEHVRKDVRWYSLVRIHWCFKERRLTIGWIGMMESRHGTRDLWHCR